MGKSAPMSNRQLFEYWISGHGHARSGRGKSVRDGWSEAAKSAYLDGYKLGAKKRIEDTIRNPQEVLQ
jgi:hypothetical protein